ncbi:cell envelope integrity protein TolA [Microbulbifer sp. 2205BS26-8]|uniref:cell envelope integrity protein TolA n=1 Tax=Microbulbifer sp. 2205BS26-8 TaxID=3064386 RepID=UPI0027401D73|nr:cell envelope integrity protein TolA [Microbulbifer sp. 2205BS26-8]MDP5210727.1 cell envelope integrity protein TolA [Microbulbifer sp. 2205BS26-8]
MKTGAYPLAIVISLLLHGTLIAVIAYGWEASRRTEHKPMPQFVQARLVTVEAVTPKKKLPQKVDKIQQRAQREAQQRQQAEIERKRRAALERKKKQAAERKRQARIEAERKAREEKAREEKERKEREQKEKERKKRLEKARQSSFDEALREEEELLEANEGEQAVMSVAQAIQLRIESVWSRPPSARNGMRTLVQINFVPTGRVVAANILEGSGNAALDRSVLTAIRKVEVFPEVAELAREEPVVFEREVRKTMLNFIVEDLRQ